MRSNRTATSAAAAPLAPSAEKTSKMTVKSGIHLVASRRAEDRKEPEGRDDLDFSGGVAPAAKTALKAAPRGDDGPGDTTLARYFRDMALHDVMGADEELKTAVAVEDAEVEHWGAILSFVPGAEFVLERLEKHVLELNEADRPEILEIDALRKLVSGAKKTKNKLSAGDQKKWNELCASLARAVRLPDSDRLWMAGAADAARSAAFDDGEEIVPGAAAVAAAPGYAKWIDRIDATHASQAAFTGAVQSK